MGMPRIGRWNIFFSLFSTTQIRPRNDPRRPESPDPESPALSTCSNADIFRRMNTMLGNALDFTGLKLEAFQAWRGKGGAGGASSTSDHSAPRLPLPPASQSARSGNKARHSASRSSNSSSVGGGSECLPPTETCRAYQRGEYFYQQANSSDRNFSLHSC
ncbi:hypothetical protein PAMP_000235 [Pampus punctatissimus]